METEGNYFAYCFDAKTKSNYFIVPSKFLKPRPKAIKLYPGVTSHTLGQQFWGVVFQSAWHESLEVDPNDGSFLDRKPDKDFEHLLTEEEYKECLIFATASSIQELQELIQFCPFKVPEIYRRLDDSVASGSQRHDEPDQRNKQCRNGESNQQTSSVDFSMVSQSSELKSVSARESLDVKPPEKAEIEIEEQIKTHDVPENDERVDSHIRPEGVANLGYFESEIDGRVTRQNADNVCVLVIHYEFENNPEYFRNGDACDVKRLKTFFGENRNCNFRNFRSPHKKTLLQLLGDREKLLQFFNSQDDVPSVFVLFILSHGDENGTILTDHFKRNTNEYECFTTDEVFDSLQRLEHCLKVVNFGPCRGSLVDCNFNPKDSHYNYENRNSCRITIRSKMHNYVVYYSTVETTMANTDENGSWLVRHICTCLNNADDEPLLKFFTIVQNRMHETSRNFTTFGENTPLGQTPELKMFQHDRKFIISKAKIISKPFSNTDGSGNVSRVSNEKHPEQFSWKSDERKDIRGRRGFILSVVQSKQVQEMKRVLQNLDFEVTDWTLNGQSMKFYFNIVSTELEPDVGCIMTCMIGPVCENQEKEVCVRVQKGREIPITDILYRLIGPKNDKLIGKPKILIVVNVEAPQTDCISVDVTELRVTATNHSGWLVLILKYEDALEKLIELFGKIDEKISLQELLEPLLTRESKREDVVLLNSTLQYLIKFPNWSRAFVKPEFKLKNTRISSDGTVSFRESLIEEKIDFDRLTEKAKCVIEENKKSIETRSCRESDTEPPINPEPIRVWLIINSVAGAGKSTVLGELAHQLNKYYGKFKILIIHLNKYYRYLFDMPAMKVSEIEFLAKTTFNSHDDIKKWMEKREVVVFLDGFDKVCPDFREKIIKILIALNNARVPLFIGTRPHEVHHIQEMIENTTIVEIEPFDEAKQIEYLRSVAGKGPEDIKKLMNILKDQDILGNPLYLKLLAENKSNGNLYEIFDKIVRSKVEICLVTKNENKDVGKHMIDKELKVIQLVASRFVTGVKIDQGSVTKKDLEEINAFGVVTYCNDKVNFTHQTFAGFLTAQKFLYDLNNPEPEKVPLFNDELVECRKFVDLFLSTEKGKDETYAETFIHWTKSIDPLKLVRQICRENLRQMFELLNPDLSIRDEHGKNALHFALRHLEMVKMVHEKNSRLATETTNDGENCLHLAIDDEECSEVVAIWLLKKTKVVKNAETIINKDSPLLLGCKRRKWKALALKLKIANFEVNKFSQGGESILHYAIKSKYLDLVQELLRRGANVNSKCQKGKTALHVAVSINNPEIVEILLDNGAAVNAQDNEKRTALHCLAAKSYPAAGILQKLLEHSADLHLKTLNGASALHLAAMWNEKPDMVKILLEKGARVNAQDDAKRNALHYAARFNPDPEVVHQLLEKGVDINLKTSHGETALFLAVKYNPVRGIVLNLLDHGAKVNKIIRNDKECAAAFHRMHINAFKIKYKLLNLFWK
ncbi:Hypothetical predicted protein [Cloeon dipterum]|uniref:Caspase family p20 domain-containing protein n=1 Tax=Cloeon dipterum TaxID=197152 RepID=A0A8S1D801_9INSE|nr:Hypothetical predicted protein [Cloeon dipterum]